MLITVKQSKLCGVIFAVIMLFFFFCFGLFESRSSSFHVLCHMCLHYGHLYCSISDFQKTIVIIFQFELKITNSCAVKICKFTSFEQPTHETPHGRWSAYVNVSGMKHKSEMSFSSILPYLTCLQTHLRRIDAPREQTKGDFTGARIP